MAKEQRVSRFTPLAESERGALRPTTSPTGRRLYKGVTIIKAGLGNSRDKNYYPAEMLESAVTAGYFDGLRAYADHPDALSEEVQPERTIRDMVGVYKNPRFVREGKSGGRVVADFNVFRSAKWLSETVDDLIELGQANKIGISINGRGRTVEKRMQLEEASDEVDVNWVEDFLQLRSADVVTEAGAGGGFQQLLESARSGGSNREKTMRLTKEQQTALKEAAETGDPEAVAAVLRECGCEAAVEPKKKAGVKEAAKADKTEKDAAKADKKTAKGDAKAARTKGNGAADETDADAEDDVPEDDELDAAVEEAKRGTDPDAEDETDEDAEADDLDESDAEDEDDLDASEDDEEETPTREAKRVAGGAGVLIKGKKGGRHGGTIKGPKDTTLGVLKPSRQGGGQSGRKFGESQEARRMRQEIEKLQESNARLSAQLRVRTTADRARNLLRESSIPEKMRPEVLRLMVGKSEDEMRSTIRYHERLVESVLEEGAGYVEGAGGSRFRESNYGGGTDDKGLSSVIDDVGLPRK